MCVSDLASAHVEVTECCTHHTPGFDVHSFEQREARSVGGKSTRYPVGYQED